MKVVITDHGFANVDPEREVLAGHELVVAQCKTPEEVIAATAGADAVLAQWAPVNADVIATLDHCKVIVRYGIGVDNVDLAAAKAKGIPVCNLPDYCVDEVADHSLALALALARQLPAIDRRTREGTWKLAPATVPLLAFRDMTFATAGFGRIARAVLERARPFGFRLAAYDPYVSDAALTEAGVERLSLDALFAEADVLSLHLPLTAETRHFINAERLTQMKPHAVLVNPSRGPLVDTAALAEALEKRTIGYAGIDVFEQEPLPLDHPLRQSPYALLTSHTAWYSEASLPKLQRLAAEEVARCLRGEPLKNQVNV
ncbi:MAG TPA: C-terminal binding protein [Rhodothermales bacterium]|nr:C-terminal binding protein [Rhodothermales bacterium]